MLSYALYGSLKERMRSTLYVRFPNPKPDAATVV